MMQYDRRSTAGKQQTKNFLAINKSSVKNKSHQLLKRGRQKHEEDQKDSGVLHNQRRQIDSSHQKAPPSSAGKKSKANEETVTISKDYLEKLLRGTLAKQSPPEINITNHSSQYHEPIAKSQSHDHVVVEHNQIPGLEGLNSYPHEPKLTAKDESKFVTASVTNSQSFDQIQVPTGLSPRGGDSYHRGTTNRPIHPAMRSQIVFGAGPGWEGEEEREREREEAKMRWMSEIAEQMKAHNPRNPASVTGRGASGPVGVGLHLQKSPKEFNEHKLKELEHKEYLLAQIEEKRRRKEEQRLKQEKEDKEEEIRVAREREKLAREFEIEKEMQRRKEIEAANKIALLQQRIRMAEQSALAAKEEKRRTRRPPQQQHQVVFNNREMREVYNQPALNNQMYDEQHNDQKYILPSKFEVDLRSPSLHTIPTSQSYEKSPSHNATSVKNSYEKLENKASKGPAPSSKKATVLPTNSQISLYSTSSEEPVTAINRRSKPRPDPSTKHTGPNNGRDSRIPRKNILRKQLEKNLQDRNKSDSESEGKVSSVKRGTASHSQLPNSVAKSRVKHDRSGGGHRLQQYRPSSTESQEDQAPRPHGTKGHSSVRNMNRIIDDHKHLPPVLQCSSPPVPAVARRLAQGQSVRFSNEVEDIHNLRNNGIRDETRNVVKENVPNDKPKLPDLQQNDQKKVVGVYHQDNEVKAEELKLPIITCANNNNSVSTRPFPVIPEVTVTSFPSVSIERAPSCSPDDHPLNIHHNEPSHRVAHDGIDWSYRNGVCSLPPIKEVMSREERRDSLQDSVTRMSTSGGTNTNSRHKEIVAQLMKLRQGILSQSQTVNSRISSLVLEKRM